MSKGLLDQGGRREGAEGTMIGGVLQWQFIWFQLLRKLKAACVRMCIVCEMDTCLSCQNLHALLFSTC